MFPAITALALTTQIVLLGTGEPGTLSRRAGPATAIVVDGRAYLVDFGPGVVRRAAAAQEMGIAGLDPANLTRAFATQLQFEHTAGYPDLLFLPIARKQPLEVYGPPGIRALTDHLCAAWNVPARVNVHEVAAGRVYRDDKVTVVAFSGGYRFQTADRNIVIASETSSAQAVVSQCNGCDVLIADVQAQSLRELSETATRARPELLIFQSHHANENELTRRIGDLYRGRFIIGHDLDVY